MECLLHPRFPDEEPEAQRGIVVGSVTQLVREQLDTKPALPVGSVLGRLQRGHRGCIQVKVRPPKCLVSSLLSSPTLGPAN